MYYGDKRDSLVAISKALRYNGWTIYGYKADESDAMIDYFSPANWQGIAIKNGFILVLDNNVGGTIGGDYISTSYDHKVAAKINKLKALMNCPSASIGEKSNAKTIIEKLDKNLIAQTLASNQLPKIEYQRNPGNSKWHIEKNGKIIAKGTGIFSFKNILRYDSSDIIFKEYEHNLRYLDYYKQETWDKFYNSIKIENYEKEQLLDKFFNLINRWEKLVIIKLGDGDEESLVEKTIIKKDIYYTAKKSNTPTPYIAAAPKWQCYRGIHKGYIYKLEDKTIKKLTKKYKKIKSEYIYTYSKEPRKNTKAKRFWGKDEDFTDGNLIYIKLVENTLEYEETVYVKATKNNNHNTQKSKSSVDKYLKNEYFEDLIKQGSLIDFIHTKTKQVLKVLKLPKKLSKEEFKSFVIYLKKQNIGYYSKFTGGFVLY